MSLEINNTPVKQEEFAIISTIGAGRRLAAVGNSPTETQAVMCVQFPTATTLVPVILPGETSFISNTFNTETKPELQAHDQRKVAIPATVPHLLQRISLEGTLNSAATGPLTAFTIFKKLPLEIQNTIFIQAASQEGRNIYALEHPSTGSRRSKSSKDTAATHRRSEWGIEMVGTSITAVLASCKGAYDAVMKIGMYKPLLQLKGRDLAYYINPDIDHVHLGSKVPLFNLNPIGTLGEYVANPADMACIRKATLPLSFMMNNSPWSIVSITPLTNLDDFRLIEHIRHRGQRTPFKLELEFIPYNRPYCRIGEDGKLVIEHHVAARPLYNGSADMDAMKRIFKQLKPRSERQRLMDLWALLGSVFEQVPNMPKITLCIDYIV